MRDITVKDNHYGVERSAWLNRAVVQWVRWGLLFTLLVLLLGGVSTIGKGESNRIRLVVAGMLCVSFHPREYIAGVNRLLSRRQTFVALVYMLMVCVSWLVLGHGENRVLRNAVTSGTIMLWLSMMIQGRADLERFQKSYLSAVMVVA